MLILKAMLLLLCITSVVCGHCTTGQPPRLILEPQDAVLPTVRDGEATTALLHCRHNTPDTTLTWYRDDEPLTYTSNRILLDNGTVEFRTLLVDIDVTPSGVRYQCMLSNAFGSVVSRTALLQSASFGRQWEGVTSPTSSVDVTLGSFILLPCDPPTANPTPSVEWTLDGTVLVANINKYKVLAPEAGSGLIIANVSASDIGPVYRCRVTNVLVSTPINSPFSYRLTQIGRYPANLTIYDTLEDVYTLETGSDVEFTCLALANDVVTLEFLFIRTDGGSVPGNVERTSHDVTSVVERTTMRITGVTKDNEGAYQCVVRNVNEQEDAIILGRRDFTIQVSIAPAITSVPDDTIFYTGDTETLECSATGFPAPVISYYFNASLITSGVSNGVLTLNNVTTANAGPYQCFADNVRADQSTLWIVTVRNPSAPVMLYASDAHAFVPGTANIVLSFGFSADPKPIVTWQLNGGDLPAMTTASLNDINPTACPMTYQAVLTVTGFTEAHSGTYTVTVENRAGTISSIFDRVLEVPATVNSLTGIGDNNNCIVRGQDSNLTCAFSGTPQPRFMWYTKIGDSDTMNFIPGSNAEYVVYTISLTETVLSIHMVGDEDNVKYGCQASNAINGYVHTTSMEKEINICAKPSISSFDDFVVIESQEVIFLCFSSGEPSLSYRWFFTNKSNVTIEIDEMTKDEYGIVIAEGSTSIKIMEATEGNAGEYICEASTDLGKVNKTVGTLSVDPPYLQGNGTSANNTSTSSKSEDNLGLFAVFIIIIVLVVVILTIVVIIYIYCFYQRFHVAKVNAKTEAYDDVVCQRIHNPIDNETILTKDNEEGVSTHLHAVKLSKANAEVYDDVINSHAIYETIPNEDNEARGGTYLQDNSTYPNNGRKDINAVYNVKENTTNVDPAYETATIKRKDTTTATDSKAVFIQSNPAYNAHVAKAVTTNTESVAMQPNPAYGVAARKDNITTNTESIAMQPNPAYGAAARKDNITTNTESIATQPNPAYGVHELDNTQRSES